MEPKAYILVTGASSGIGREVAVRLSEDYPVIIAGRNRERLEKTRTVCNRQFERLIWEYDLANLDDLEESLAQFILENKCEISGFVHSAGFFKMQAVKMITAGLFQSSFNINVISAALITKVLKKKKLNQNALKSIVFISSNISNFGAKAFTAYAASKSAVDGLMRCLAVELAPDVRVNSVLPGGIRTAMTEQTYQNAELVERMDATYPLGPGSVKDIANAVKFLLGEDSRWITGQQLFVDGGRTINITG
jgi:NAD(P)-dependent dehydrogenase (short-subunit alcohol dehydrogenase family)